MDDWMKTSRENKEKEKERRKEEEKSGIGTSVQPLAPQGIRRSLFSPFVGAPKLWEASVPTRLPAFGPRIHFF